MNRGTRIILVNKHLARKLRTHVRAHYQRSASRGGGSGHGPVRVRPGRQRFRASCRVAFLISCRLVLCFQWGGGDNKCAGALSKWTPQILERSETKNALAQAGNCKIQTPGFGQSHGRSFFWLVWGKPAEMIRITELFAIVSPLDSSCQEQCGLEGRK